MKDKLKQKQVEAQTKFDKLESKRKELIDQRATLDRQISAVAEEQIRLQGEFRALSDLLEEGKPKSEIPSKKK